MGYVKTIESFHSGRVVFHLSKRSERLEPPESPVRGISAASLYMQFCLNSPPSARRGGLSRTAGGFHGSCLIFQIAILVNHRIKYPPKPPTPLLLYDGIRKDPYPLQLLHGFGKSKSSEIVRQLQTTAPFQIRFLGRAWAQRTKYTEKMRRWEQ